MKRRISVSHSGAGTVWHSRGNLWKRVESTILDKIMIEGTVRNLGR